MEWGTAKVRRAKDENDGGVRNAECEIGKHGVLKPDARGPCARVDHVLQNVGDTNLFVVSRGQIRVRVGASREVRGGGLVYRSVENW